jgi:hypothetical protein
MARAGYGTSARRMLRYSRVLNSNSSTPEIKLVDNVNGAAGISLALNATGDIQALNLIQSGSGFYNRIGRKIEMLSLYVTGEINQTTTATTYNDYARVLVIYDRQCNGALPALATILSAYDQSGTSTTNYLSGINPDERERFLVLMDERMVLPACPGGTGVTGSVDGLAVTFNIKRFIKLRNLAVHFKADSSPAVIGDIATGSLFIVGIGRRTAGQEGWQGNINIRLRYKDT